MIPEIEFTKILRCTECSGDIDENYVCRKCQKKFPVVRNVVRFVESESYVSNFGFEWNKHKRTQYDSENHKPSESFLRQIGLNPELVKGKLVLDAGCGTGRFSDVIERWGGTPVCIDLSSAVEACYENLGGRGIRVIQGNILNPPFKNEVFDVIFSIGVLHHTPNTRKAFEALVPLLKPGGFITIWVYHAYNDGSLRIKLSNFYRKFTWRVPTQMLYTLSHVAITYYYLNRIPLLGSITGRLLHIAEHKDWRWRVLDTFDWYSPRYQWHHTYSEVWKWFEEAGLTNIKIYEPPVSVSGYKPL